MKLVERTLFFDPAPPGISLHGNAYYIRAEGVEKARVRSVSTRSDITDTTEISYSTDNGRSWSDSEELVVSVKTTKGVRRFGVYPGFADPDNGCYLSIILEGLLPSDDPMEGLTEYFLRYAVSKDGGRTSIIDQQIIQAGDYTSDHPFEGVWVGKNSIFLGDLGSQTIKTRAGKLLVPAQITPIGADGKYYNPGGGYTYHECMALIGEWQDDLSIKWDVSERVKNDPAVSTRGAIEPTIAEMPDGRILMIIRGSNDVKPELPGYKWYSVSEDGGYHWSKPKPWTYTSGENFFSPSSCSQLIRHSTGRYFWLGNIACENPEGNLPRRPFVIGEVDAASLQLIKESVLTIDDLQPGEDPTLMLSNFMAHEDRETHEIVLHLSRFFASHWQGNAYVYRIEV